MGHKGDRAAPARRGTQVQTRNRPHKQAQGAAILALQQAGSFAQWQTDRIVSHARAMAPCAPSSEGSAPARSSQGPLFRGVPSFDWNRVPRDRPTTLAQLAQSATTPVVVRGAAASWPACADKKCSWSFERLAELAECDGRLEAPLQNGLIEQGATQVLLHSMLESSSLLLVP